MKIAFHPITLQDKERIQEVVSGSPYQNCDLSFANLYNWSSHYKTQIAFHKGAMVVRFMTDGGTRPAYLMPIGEVESLKDVFADMMCDCCTNGEHLLLMSITEPSLKLLDEILPNRYRLLPNRDYYDYIYEREKLCSLSGKKLQSKRNHINKFERSYPDYIYEPITASNAMECMELENKWFALSGKTDEINAEREIICRSLREKEAIGLTGGAIRVNGFIVAFSMGMPINCNTFDVSIEKADPAIPEAFAMINREFARHIPEQYTYINREEDLGIEGLRKAKLSYKPDILLEKNIVIVHTDV